MTDISDILSDLPDYIVDSLNAEEYQIGNRRVRRTDAKRLAEAMALLRQMNNESGNMCTVGRILKAT